eukprot:3659443-Pleurochrysis_carterae.AAC.1
MGNDHEAKVNARAHRYALGVDVRVYAIEDPAKMTSTLDGPPLTGSPMPCGPSLASWAMKHTNGRFPRRARDVNYMYDKADILPMKHGSFQHRVGGGYALSTAENEGGFKPGAL